MVDDEKGLVIVVNFEEMDELVVLVAAVLVEDDVVSVVVEDVVLVGVTVLVEDDVVSVVVEDVEVVGVTVLVEDDVVSVIVHVSVESDAHPALSIVTELVLIL